MVDIASLVHTSKSVEWYTPAIFIYAAKRVMGGIDLDPASCEEAQKVVKARKFFTIEDDGLSKRWDAGLSLGSASVFLNPPQGKVGNVSRQGIWARAMRTKFEAGEFSEGILLVNANTSEYWFTHLFDFPICFVEGRIRFTPPAGTSMTGPTKGNCFIYFGSYRSEFEKEFRQFGRVTYTATSRLPYRYKGWTGPFCDNCGEVVEPGALCDSCGVTNEV